MTEAEIQTAQALVVMAAARLMESLDHSYDSRELRELREAFALLKRVEEGEAA